MRNKIGTAVASILFLIFGLYPSFAKQPPSPQGLVAFTNTTISIIDCAGKQEEKTWQIDVGVYPLANCESVFRTTRSNRPVCPDKMEVFEVLFRGSDTAIFAESVAMNRDGFVFIDTFEPWARSVGAIDSIEMIVRRQVCRDELNRAAHFPPDYCTETRIIAVDFNFDSFFSNRILTNGFTYKIVKSGTPKGVYDATKFASEVRNGFQGAVMLWTSALAENDPLLTSPVRAFIASRTHSSENGYQLLLPPQVVQVSCSANATFVIRLQFENGPQLPRRPLMLARAQIEGRTIALNLAQFKCFRSEMKFDGNKNLRFELDDGCFNLLPILTHELGHAFGLRHHDEDASDHAIMDPSFSRDALTPQKKDVRSLVIALERSITGARPGELEFMPSNGVAPPAGVEEHIWAD